jgi:hypothetical protein
VVGCQQARLDALRGRKSRVGGDSLGRIAASQHRSD